jgi:hypothetical protein
LIYPNIYIGAGVAVGDIDNDGLEDIYFAANFDDNRLYKNIGDFQFEDISSSSNTTGPSGFPTGVSMLDINNDGWLDIYVCRAGSLRDHEGRRNLLYINQKDGTFSEQAKQWGLDDPGFSTQAYSIDYDKDGDLDLYLVNHRYDFNNTAKLSGEIQSRIEEITSDQLYRNDGTQFTKVTGEARLYNKTWGLSASIGDFNNDGWDDIYVANDFIEPDQLYINQKDGTFKNEINQRFNHFSYNSMGSDFADLNNDLYLDLMTLDMLAENYARSKENMGTMNSETFNMLTKVGYHYAYSANMLHYNKGNGIFQESGQLSGITKTDWSWAPLISDFDNDGLKDIYISNGVYKDHANQDYRVAIEKRGQQGGITLQEVLDMMPAEKLSNYMYKNKGDQSFEKVIQSWGLDDPSFSNGAAYADLDNDGDLDIVTNNINSKIGLYKNNSQQNHLQINLKGPKNNVLGLGSSIYVLNQNMKQLKEQYMTRGFLSSITKVIHFGLGKEKLVQQVIVQWPDGKVSELNNVKANQRITVDYASSTAENIDLKQFKTAKKNFDISKLGVNFHHSENSFDDYMVQLLLPHKQSTKGTGLATADANGDGLDDFFVGNALGSAAALYLQDATGKFKSTNESLWKSEAKYEDANAHFFDADNDGDQDLYVVSAGYELSEKSPLLQDRLYTNDGKGNFRKNNKALPKMLSSGKTVVSGDYDGDGDLDLFIGGNVVPGKYPLAPQSFLLNNDGGIFTDVTSSNVDLARAGMVSEAIFTDYDNDEDLDIMLVGEWMNPTIFTNNDGVFSKTDIPGFENSEGWWFSVVASDFDGDGDQDYVFGNLGKNNKFQPKKDKPIYIYGKDFDDNGSFDVALSKINEGKLVPFRGKQCSSEQNPFLLEKIQSYKEFASLDMSGIYGEEKLDDAYQLVAHTFETSYAENLGDGTFKIIKLPNQVQTGPTLSIIATDVNKDGFKDIMGMGAIYDAEVETIRYDSNFGYVLLGDGTGAFSYAKEYDPFIISDAKDMTQLSIQGKPYYLVVSNNAPLEIFTFKP